LKCSIVRFIKDTLWVAAVVCGGLAAGLLYVLKIVVRMVAQAILPSWLLRCAPASLMHPVAIQTSEPGHVSSTCTYGMHDGQATNLCVALPEAVAQPQCLT
jgi:hypothetical protein